MKKLIALLLTGTLLFPMCGCSTESISLIDKLFSADKIESANFDGSLKIKLSAELPTELIEDTEPFSINSLFSALSDYSLTYSGSMINSKNDVKANYKYTVATPDSHKDYTFYVTGDRKNPELTAYIPTPLRALLPDEYQDAHYVTTSVSEYIESVNNRMYPMCEDDEETKTDIYASAMTMTSEMKEAFISLASKLDVQKCVKRSGNVYTVKLTNESFRDILTQIVDSQVYGDELMEDVISISDSYRNYMKAVNSEIMDEEAFEESDFRNYLMVPGNINKLKIWAEEFKTGIEDMSFFGNDGLELKFTVGNGGIITKTEINGTIALDINKITELTTGSADYDEPFIINANISAISKLTDVNCVKAVNIPSLEEENKIKLADWIDAYSPDYDYDNDYDYDYDYDYEYEESRWRENVSLPLPNNEIALFDQDYLVDIKNPVIMQDGVAYVAADDIFDRLQLNHQWDGTYILYPCGVYDNAPITRLYIDSEIMNIDGIEVKMRAKTFVVGDVLYIPIKDVLLLTNGYTVFYEPEKNSITFSYSGYYEKELIKHTVED